MYPIERTKIWYGIAVASIIIALLLYTIYSLNYDIGLQEQREEFLNNELLIQQRVVELFQSKDIVITYTGCDKLVSNLGIGE